MEKSRYFEELVVGEFWRELRIGVDAVECPIEFGRDFTLDLKIRDITFETNQAKNAGKQR